MKTIKSKDNNTYKSALKLIKKKYRDETGLYLLEGVKPLEDAISMGVSVKTIFLCEGTEKPESFPTELCMVLDRKLFEALSDTSTPQGIIAVTEKKKYSVEAFEKAIGNNGNVVVMDRLQDPGNIGTIIRTAEAAGYRGIILVFLAVVHLITPISRLTSSISSSMSSLTRIPVAYITSSIALSR